VIFGVGSQIRDIVDNLGAALAATA